MPRGDASGELSATAISGAPSEKRRLTARFRPEDERRVKISAAPAEAWNVPHTQSLACMYAGVPFRLSLAHYLGDLLNKIACDWAANPAAVAGSKMPARQNGLQFLLVNIIESFPYLLVIAGGRPVSRFISEATVMPVGRRISA